MKISFNITMLMSLILATAISACDNEVSPEMISDENLGNEVRINAVIEDDSWNELSRASYPTDIDREEFKAGDKIGVFGYYLPNGTSLSADSEPDFMNNQEMTFNGSTWDYSPLKYWPNNNGDKLAFWAYYPYGMSNTTLQYNIETGQPELTFTKLPYYNDILVAEMVNSARTTATSAVPLHFRHILAKVNLILALNDYVDENIPDPTLKIKYVEYHNIYTSGKFKGFIDGVAQWEDCGDLMLWYDPAVYELKPGDKVFVDQDYTFFIPFYVDHISFVPLIVPGEGGTVNNKYYDDNGLGTYTEENFTRVKDDDDTTPAPDAFDFYLSKRGFGENGVYVAPGTETTITINLGLYGVDNVEVNQRPIAEWASTSHTDVYY